MTSPCSKKIVLHDFVAELEALSILANMRMCRTQGGNTDYIRSATCSVTMLRELLQGLPHLYKTNSPFQATVRLGTTFSRHIQYFKLVAGFVVIRERKHTACDICKQMSVVACKSAFTNFTLPFQNQRPHRHHQSIPRMTNTIVYHP